MSLTCMMSLSSISILGKAIRAWENRILSSWGYFEERNMYQPLTIDLLRMEKQC